MKIKIIYILILSLFILPIGNNVKLLQTLNAQDFEDDDFSDDDEYEDEKSTETETDDKNSKKEEVNDKKENPPTKEEKKKDNEDNEDDEFSEDDEYEDDKAEKERLRKEDEAAEKAEREKEERIKQANLKRAADAEKRLRIAKENEAKRRRLKYSEKVKRHTERKAYKSYFDAIMAKENIKTRMPAMTGWAVALNMGIQPNIANSVNEGFTFSEQMIFRDQQNRALLKLPFNVVNSRENKGIANTANIFKNTVNSLNEASKKGAKVEKSSTGIMTVPLGANISYYGSFYLFRLGALYHNSIIGLGGTNKFSFTLDKSKFTVEHKASVQRLEVPFSMALRFLHNRAFGAYLGVGGNFFWGQNVSEIKTTGQEVGSGIILKLQDEKDVFTATGFGFHFLMGIEAEVYKDFFLTVELFQNVGYSKRVVDSHIDALTNSTTNTAETQKADELVLNFSGTEIIIGVRKFL